MKRAALVLVVLALSACQPAPVPTHTTSTATSVSTEIFVPTTLSQKAAIVVDLGAGIELALTGTVEAKSSPVETCAVTLYALTTATGEFQAELLSPDCDWAEQPMNGNHGFYVRAPATATVERVPTPIGEAVVFANEYKECTNSCHAGTDEVALVTVGTRVVQVIAVTRPANKVTTSDRAGLIALLQGLRKP